MKMKNLIVIKYFIVFAVMFLSCELKATVYYVDATSGSDSNNGTSATSAWKTLTKVNNTSSSFVAGDSILFKQGETWKGERLFAISHPSGTSAMPITYSSYGSGARPIIDIVVDKSTVWTDNGNNVWSTPTANYQRFFRNGTEMLRAGDINYLGSYGTKCFVGSGQLYVYSTTDPSTDTFSWAKYSEAISFKEADYINIVGLDIRGGSSASVKIYNNEGWVVENCNIGFNAGYGCVVKYSSNITIKNCSFDSNLTVDQSQLPGSIRNTQTGCTDGILVSAGSHYITIEHCFFKNWGHASFGSDTDDPLNKISHITFRNNELTSPDILYGGRMGYSGYSEDGEYYNNYIHDISVANQLGGSRNHFHHNIIDGVLDSPLKTDKVGIGIWVQNYNVQVRDNIIENNLIANTESKGFEIYSINWDKPNEFSGNIFRNNIIYNCGTKENNIAIQFHEDKEGQNIYNNTVTNNLIYSVSSTQTCLYQFNGTLCDVATFNTLNSNISNNIGAYPLFVTTPGDFHLQAGSPAIDAGTQSLATVDFDGNDIPDGVATDIGVYEYQLNVGINDVMRHSDPAANKILNSYKFLLFPNPATNQVFVSDEFINEDYQIFSLSGKVVKTGRLDENSIAVPGLKSGIYLIKFTGEKGRKSEVMKFVKK